MADERELITAEQLDAMTPDQRAAAFNERIVRDLDELPDDVRARIEETGRHVATEPGLSPSP